MMFSRSVILRRASESMRSSGRYLCGGGTGSKGDSTKLMPSVQAVPKPNEITQENSKFDQITHTGQAWDQADHRLARFTFAEKQVNPNIAAHLIAEQKPIPSEERVVRCDGGHSGLGHPRVYINLDKPGTHACGYCGLRFYNTHTTKLDQLDVAHIQV